MTAFSNITEAAYAKARILANEEELQEEVAVSQVESSRKSSFLSNIWAKFLLASLAGSLTLVVNVQKAPDFTSFSSVSQPSTKTIMAGEVGTVVREDAKRDDNEPTNAPSKGTDSSFLSNQSMFATEPKNNKEKTTGSRPHGTALLIAASFTLVMLAKIIPQQLENFRNKVTTLFWNWAEKITKRDDDERLYNQRNDTALSLNESDLNATLGTTKGQSLPPLASNNTANGYNFSRYR